MVMARKKELRIASDTEMPIVPVKSPTPPGAMMMGVKASTVVRVEAPRGTNRCRVAWLMAPAIGAPRCRRSL